MWNVLHMRVTYFGAVVAPHTDKIMKNGLMFFDTRENLLQNGVFHFVFRLNQSSEIVLQS